MRHNPHRSPDRQAPDYATPSVPADWANSRHTDMAVATAIHAIASDARSPEAIWDAPTPAEWDHVVMAVANYVATGVFAPNPQGYCWGGYETVHVNLPADITLRNHGTICILYGASNAGQDWLDDHLPTGATRWGGGIVIETNHLDDILAGANADGLRCANLDA